MNDPARDDDRDLGRRCLAGDAGAMRALVEKYQGVVFGLCYRMLGDRHDAEDVAQEVFLRAFRHLGQWEPERPLKPWLLTIAVNRCRTARGRAGREPLATEYLEETVATPPGRDSNPDLAEELQLAVQRLREEYRTCFILFYQQELSCQEIGRMLNCPEGTVKTWLHRARRELADHLRRRGVVSEVGYELHGI